MKTQTLLAAATVLLAAVSFAPGAAAQDLCNVHPTYARVVCCQGATDPTLGYVCTVRGATVGYAMLWVNAVLDLERCLVEEEPIGNWLGGCVRID